MFINNRTNDYIVFLNNVPMTLVEASEKIGVKYDCLRQRVKRSNNKYINI
jgi:hypothetical protein